MTHSLRDLFNNLILDLMNEFTVSPTPMLSSTLINRPVDCTLLECTHQIGKSLLSSILHLRIDRHAVPTSHNHASDINRRYSPGVVVTSKSFKSLTSSQSILQVSVHNHQTMCDSETVSTVEHNTWRALTWQTDTKVLYL